MIIIDNEKCVGCGHCVAVCPAGAVSIPDYDMDDVEEYERAAFETDPDVLLRAIKFRRSIRNFKEEKPDRKELEKILQAGRYTPTAHNSQQSRFRTICSLMHLQ